jgi:hypothetical protein
VGQRSVTRVADKASARTSDERLSRRNPAFQWISNDVCSAFVPGDGAVEATEVGLKFPVLGFTPDREIWGFPNLDSLTRCGPRTLKEDSQVGMELIDAACRRWRVLSIRRVGRTGSILSLLWIFGPPQSRIEQELEPLPAVSLAAVQGRALEALALVKDDYYADDGQAEYKATRRKVGNARSVVRIYDLLQPDTFEPY